MTIPQLCARGLIGLERLWWTLTRARVRLAYLRHRPDQALQRLRPIAVRRPGDVELRLLLAELELAAGELERAIAEAGLHPATGGDGSLLCSGDMLLEALAACAGVTLRAVATALELDIRGVDQGIIGYGTMRSVLVYDNDLRGNNVWAAAFIEALARIRAPPANA